MVTVYIKQLSEIGYNNKQPLGGTQLEAECRGRENCPVEEIFEGNCSNGKVSGEFFAGENP